MPIDFPSSPYHGQAFVSGDTVWEYSSAVPGWNVDRTAIVNTTDDLITGSNFSNNSILSEHLVSEYYIGSVDANSTTAGNTVTIRTVSSKPAGQYIILASINCELSDVFSSTATYIIEWGATEVGRTVIENYGANLGQTNQFVMSTMIEPSVSGAITLKQAATGDTIDGTGTSLTVIRVGGDY